MKCGGYSGAWIGYTSSKYLLKMYLTTYKLHLIKVIKDNMNLHNTIFFYFL